ncbi:trypsin-like peptidase domain-containing protein [Streptacidiphilus sp. P02-A3a]|uniref:trypsin-like peptidase domain-containing protein n=1 Tax=Streptacidiphilus sp. P02-A3a TaxID=2704468 RepID=UPI001CDBD1EF|nr:trypsin-like peptidase domain-containing protein [Streptacidiphilus sp. P02-A3a]
MSTEHEGGLSGPDRSEPTTGDSVAPPAAQPDASASGIEPPRDPDLAAYPPPAPDQPALDEPTTVLAAVPAEAAPAAAPAAPAEPSTTADAPVAAADAVAPTAQLPTAQLPAVQPAPADSVPPAAVPAETAVAAAAPGYPAPSAPPAPPAPPSAAPQPYAGYPQPGEPPQYPQYAQHPQYGQYQGAPYPAAYPGAAYPGTPFGAPQAPRKRRRGGLATLLVVTALVAGGLGGGLGSWLETRDSSGGSTSVAASVNPKDLSRSPNSIAGIAARSLPSVVTISASNSQESGTGTGFIFDSRGYILTNNHVVAPSTNGGKLSVQFSDGNSYPATIVGRAEGYDVAVIKLGSTPKEKLVPLPLGNSDSVAVGDTTIAIGAPFGLSGTVTSGIISAKNRPVASGDETGTQTSYMNALQTDASINPGNSGGPLMNSDGQVIGIDSAIQSGGATDSEGQSGSVGLGFAIPINQAEWVAAQLIKTGQPIYPIIGILRDDSYTGNGAKIASAPVQGQPAVTPGEPAAKAGLEAGDVITQFAGVPIDSGPTLVSEIWSHHPGDTVSITYTRNGQTHTTTLTLGSRVGDAQ